MPLSRTDVDEFVNAWKETIARSSVIRPYNERREALVLSFDDELNPFLNYTKGYHYPKDKRTYFKTVPKVLRQIGKRMAPCRGTGGRVFIDNEKAYYIDESLISTDLCELCWPNDRDAIAEIRGYWRARRRATIILTKVKWN
jgi:hypothetical protein